MKRLSFLLVVSFVTVFVYSPLAAQDDSLFTVEQIFTSGRFSMKTLSSVKWVDGGRKFSYFEVDTVTRQRNLYFYTISDGERELVMDGSLLVHGNGTSPMRVGSYEWSKDGKNILVTGFLHARRIKTGGNFGLFDVETKSFRMLTDTTAPQAIIKFSPDGSKIGFVRSNNLFVMDVETGAETQLTFDGSDVILNGVFDWVYEEEFAIIDGWEWSPDGKRIAFWRFDQSAVPTFPLVRYPVHDQYPDIELMRYPKAGDTNALVQIGVVNVETKETRWLQLSENPDVYYPRLQWTHDPEVLSVQRLNRAQDTLLLMLVNAATGEPQTVLTETDTTWVDVHDNPRFLQRSERFLWTSPRDGFNHVYLFENDGRLVRQVTKGEWDVTEIVYVSERRNLVYFMATQASPLERHLYSIKLDGTGLRRLTREPGWHEVNFSPDGLVYIDTYSSATTPAVISLRSNDGTLIAKLVENTTESLRGYRLGEHRFFTFRTSDAVLLNPEDPSPRDVLNGWMILPPGFDPDKRYPVMMYVYGSGSQTVVNRWGGLRSLWHHMLAQKGYIVASVDGRGTEGRGKSFLRVSHRRLGMVETNDQIEAAKYLSSLPYVDSTRIGIWGWSGGGYMTCMAMTLGSGRFKAGIAVAPVTDFRFYNTIWTERYMGKPSENAEGYRETAPLTHVSKLQGNLLLVHGTTDDNVHWQNVLVFVDEAIKHNKQVSTMFYPGRNHGIAGNNATVHLYTMMTEYILRHL